MSEPPQGDRLPQPFPGEEAAASRARNPVPPADGSEPSLARRIAKPMLISLVGFAISMAIPILIVVILAFVAQQIIAGH